MEETYSSTTVEMDKTGFDDLKDQIINKKTEPSPSEKHEKTASSEKKTERSPYNKKYVFKKGDLSVEIDDDYELEFTADKRPTKLSLRELKDRAAGDIAIKNRMHSLAEEKKRIQATFRQFADIAKTDPLGALEFISNQAKETVSDFEYNAYIEKLADQAEKLGKMDEKDRKAWELEKKLLRAEENLSQSKRKEAVVLRKQELLSDYPEIGDSQFSEMVDAVLSNEEILEGIEDEHGVMDRVEELIQETLTQRDILSVIEEINPYYMNDNDLIFSLSDQLRQNPDLDEEDVREIIGELIRPMERIRTSMPQNKERQKDIQTLSNKARQSADVAQMRNRNMTPFQSLQQQLLEFKKNNTKTPLSQR